jgi:hypothetical protein
MENARPDRIVNRRLFLRVLTPSTAFTGPRGV